MNKSTKAILDELHSNELRMISIRQPYAELMLSGKIETRDWKTNYRGLVLICASKHAMPNHEIEIISGTKQINRMNKYLCAKKGDYEGKAIAIGRLIDCRPMTKHDEDACFVQYFKGLYCHIYSDMHKIIPFQVKGFLGYTNVDEAVKKNIQILTK